MSFFFRFVKERSASSSGALFRFIFSRSTRAGRVMITGLRTIFEGRGQSEAAEAGEEARMTATRKRTRSNGAVDGGVELFDFISRFVFAAAGGGDIVDRSSNRGAYLVLHMRYLREHAGEARAPFRGANEKNVLFFFVVFPSRSLTLSSPSIC